MLVILIDFLLLPCMVLSDSQWVVSHSNLPSYNKNHPKAFTIDIGWSVGDEITSVTLNLSQNDAVNRRLPLYANNKDGCPALARLLNLKHTAYYHDLANQASISLTSFDGEDYSMKGSFLVENEKYDLAPYNQKLHKRSLGAIKGDHVVEMRDPQASAERTDYKLPPEGSTEYSRLMRAWGKVADMEAKKAKGESRKKRQNLPDVTYTIELYIVVDYFAYKTLADLAVDLEWPNDDDDFIAFYMGHQANEIDIRYRSIDSSVSPVFGSWSMRTKLSFLHIAKTTDDSPWTYPPAEFGHLYLDGGNALDAINNWTNANLGTLSAADHVMLITSLDMYYQSSLVTIGLAWVGGACADLRTSIIELGSATAYAHELGHNLGASHDGSGNSCSGEDAYIMAPYLGLTSETTRANPWYFSTCSVEYFDAYLSELGANVSCLENAGSYVATWADDSSGHLGQEIPLDKQCTLIHGEGYMFYPLRLDQVCYSLYCWPGVNLEALLDASRPALPYSSCGNKKWCVEEECVYDARAPELDESCPFGDARGTVYLDADYTCSDISPVYCNISTYTQQFCCATCREFETPWLGPSCPYGDTVNGCEDLSFLGCQFYAEACCESCCQQNGPADGYTCDSNSTTIDQDECQDSTLNDCDSNAECIDTSWGYTCICKTDYKDVSPYENEPGRTCTPICDEYCSGAERSLYSIWILWPALVLAAYQRW